ncbi:hypothetical protein UY3_07824 [Chelonia mydas]|uniref:Uncharacterized protein n=1 Tax=Chelonia mydas TaxID=8469 RepID=M7BAP3_CHEMY|nr:hypothetical protein UY3_07824 [Chelonia mydas]
MFFYKRPTDAKKPELPMGAPARVQKRRPIYTYFVDEAGPLPNPAFHPEIELKKQENFTESLTVIKEEKDRVRKNLLQAFKEANSKMEITKPRLYRITVLVCDEEPTDAEPEEYDEGGDTVPDSAATGDDDDDDDSESDEGMIEVAQVNFQAVVNGFHYNGPNNISHNVIFTVLLITLLTFYSLFLKTCFMQKRQVHITVILLKGRLSLSSSSSEDVRQKQRKNMF